MLGDTFLTINSWQIKSSGSPTLSHWVNLTNTIGFTGVSLEVQLTSLNLDGTPKFDFTRFKERASAFKAAGKKVILRLVADGPGLIDKYWDEYKIGTVTVSGSSVTGSGGANWSGITGIAQNGNYEIAFNTTSALDYSVTWYPIQSVTSPTQLTLTTSAGSYTNVPYVITRRSIDHLFQYILPELTFDRQVNIGATPQFQYAIKKPHTVYALNIYNPECQAMFERFIRDAWDQLAEGGGDPKQYADFISLSWGRSWETDAMLIDPPSGKTFFWRTPITRTRVSSTLRNILTGLIKAAEPFTKSGIWVGAQVGSLWHVPHWRLTGRRPKNETALHLADVCLPDFWYGSLGSTNSSMYELVACFSSDVARGLGLKFVVNEYDTHTSRSNTNHLSTLGILNDQGEAGRPAYWIEANERMVKSAKRALERGIHWQIMHWEYEELLHDNARPRLQEICSYASDPQNSPVPVDPPIVVSGTIRQIFDAWRSAVGLAPNDYQTIPNKSVPVIIKNLKYES